MYGVYSLNKIRQLQVVKTLTGFGSRREIIVRSWLMELRVIQHINLSASMHVRNCISKRSCSGRRILGRLISFFYHWDYTSGKACASRDTLGRLIKFLYYRDCTSGGISSGQHTWGRLIRFLHCRDCRSRGTCPGRHTLGCLIMFFYHWVYVSGTLAVFQGAARYHAVTRNVSCYDFHNGRIGIVTRCLILWRMVSITQGNTRPYA